MKEFHRQHRDYLKQLL
jgi:hypothetical protein